MVNAMMSLLTDSTFNIHTNIVAYNIQKQKVTCTQICLQLCHDVPLNRLTFGIDTNMVCLLPNFELSMFRLVLNTIIQI